MTELQKTGFDYSTLGAGVREDITTATTNIRKRARRMATDILEIGLEARRVKSYLDHGQFVQWVEAEFAEEFGWSYQSVMRFVQVSEHFYQTSQKDLICHLLGCTRSEVAERLVERFGTEHAGFLRVLEEYL